jgi:hypothetical protein
MDALKSKKAKLGIVILALLLGASYYMMPDEKVNIKGVKVSQGSGLSLEELKKQDEEYRKMQMEGKVPPQYQKQAQNNPQNPNPKSNDGIIKTDDKEALAAFKQQLLNKEKSNNNLNPEETKKTDTQNAKPVALDDAKRVEENNNKEIEKQIVKTKEETKTTELEDLELTNQVHQNHYPEPDEMSPLEESNSENLETNRFHILVRQTGFYATKILVNKSYYAELESTETPSFYSFSIPKTNLNSILIEACFTHEKNQSRSPSASELVRIEILDMSKFDRETRIKETKRFHHETLKSLISPLGSDFEPGKEDCKSTEILDLHLL